MNNKYIHIIIVILSISSTLKPEKLKIGDMAHGGIIAWIDDTGEHV